MTARATPASRHSNASNLFILVLTVLSLVVMVLLLLPLIFLVDFALNLKGAPPSEATSSANAAGWTSSAPSPASASCAPPRSCGWPA
jgi:hypothetical protein